MALDTKFTTDSMYQEVTRATREPDGKDGVVGSVLALSIGMIETGVRTTASLSRTLTAESQKVIDGVIQLNEQASQALFRTSRKVTESVFNLAAETIERSERAALVVLHQSQKTTDRAAELVAQASQVAVGSRGVAAASGQA